MSRPRYVDLARGLMGRLDNGDSPTWPEAQERAAGLLDEMTKRDLADVATYLAVQLNAERNRVDQDARLAMTQIGAIVRAYQEASA